MLNDGEYLNKENNNLLAGNSLLIQKGLLKKIFTPSKTGSSFYWTGKYDGNDLVNEVGVNIPWVSGTGLDAIYDFSVLSDVRLDKSSATYWTQPLDSYFYYDALNPYRYKLKDFHYREFQNQMESDNNYCFCKLTYSAGVLISADELYIYDSEQIDKLSNLKKYILFTFNTYFYINENITFLQNGIFLQDGYYLSDN